MSNEDNRKRFGRFPHLTTSVQKSDESGYAKKDSDDPPPVVSGRGRMLAELAVCLCILLKFQKIIFF